jgi:hypothetical protein
MIMMPGVVPEIAAALQSRLVVDDEGVGAASSPAVGAAWSPPFGRDTSSDAALFAPYADCGPGSVTNQAAGVCEAIPGYAEGFAEVGKITAMMDAAAEDKRRRAEARRPKMDAMNECMIDGFYEAQEECAAGRLPLEARPSAMSAAQCEALWRSGSGGGTASSEQRAEDSSTTALTRGYTGSVGGELDLGGLKLGAQGEERQESSDSHTRGRSRGTSSSQTLRPFRGYLESCRADVAARFVKDK